MKTITITITIRQLHTDNQTSQPKYAHITRKSKKNKQQLEK